MVSTDSATDILKARFVGSMESPQLKIRQMPVGIGEDTEYILQFGADNMFPFFLNLLDENTKCQKDYHVFAEKIRILSEKELNNSLRCHYDEMINVLSSTISCVGCRRAVENSFNLVSAMDYNTLSPIKLIKCHEHESSCEFTLEFEYLRSPKKLFMLLYVCKPHMEYVVNNIPKSRKNKRCYLHCLDSHKVKSISVWMDFWKTLNRDSREEITTINIDAFVEALESYLQKHRFCQECKAKVERAYKLLLKDVKPDETDQEYDEIVFEGIKVCKADRHLHIDSDDETISSLINRAEPELTNSRRERHAKTMDVAQEEVLTCLGIVLHEKMHKLCQKVKAEEQTWLILLNVCLECLKRRLVLAVEDKRGYSNMDLFLLEHEEETKKKEMKKEIKRQKKKQKKLARKVAYESNDHSPSKDEYSYNEEDDDDEDDDDDEEEEKEKDPPKAPDKVSDDRVTAPKSCQFHSSHKCSKEGHEKSGESSEWQVVDCKQCNKRKMKSRGPGDHGDSGAHSFSPTEHEENAHMKKSAHQGPCSIDRHSNAQYSSSGNSVNAKKKSKANGDTSLTPSVMCCGGAAARSPLKTEKSASTNYRGSSSVQKSRVWTTTASPNNNSKRSQCSRISHSPLSNIKSSSSSSLPSTANSTESSYHQPADKSSSSTELSCNYDQTSHAHGRTHSCSTQAVVSERGESCCQQDSKCKGAQFHDCSEPSVHKSKPSTIDSLSFRPVSFDDAERKILKSDDSDPVLTTGCSSYSTDDLENGEDFLTEQEREFFADNWEEIKKNRDILRSKLRQAWSDVTKQSV